MRLLLGTGLFSVIALSTTAARAVEDDLPVAKENPRIVPVIVGDAYYAYHDPQPSGGNATLATSGSRHNEIAVNLLAIGARLEHAKLTGTFILQAGSSVDALHSGVAAPVATNVEVWKHIQLANVGWKMGDFHVEAGVLPSLSGFESFVATQNWNYLRAIVADSTPYYVTGLRATYRVAPTFAVTATVFNGWDVHGDRNKQKSGQLRVLWEPSDKLSVSNSLLVGVEQEKTVEKIEAGKPTYAATATRIYDDLVITYRVHARVQLALQGWFGTDRELRVRDPRRGDAVNEKVEVSPMYYGGALWGRWQFGDTTYIALRGEAVHDRYGVLTGRGARTDKEPAPGQRMLAGTVTLGWQPHPRLLARVEAMHRISDEPFFAGSDARTYQENVFAPGGASTFETIGREQSTTFVASAAFSY